MNLVIHYLALFMKVSILYRVLTNPEITLKFQDTEMISEGSDMDKDSNPEGNPRKLSPKPEKNNVSYFINTAWCLEKL